MRKTSLLSCLLLLMAGNLWGQARDDTQDRIKALEERVLALEAEIKALKAAQAPPPSQGAPAAPPVAAEQPAPPPSAPATAAQAPAAPAQVELAPGAPMTPSGPLPVYGGASAAAKVLNPDISVIGDFIGTTGHNPVHPVPALEMHESEVGLQAIIDPYARGDVFFSFGTEGVQLEEGYLTFTSLPGGFVAKVGKMRAEFGKVNTIHNHALPWIDRPLVTDSLVNGEDGLSDAGISLSRILPAPKDIFLEGTAQLFAGNSGSVFKSSRASDVSFVGHLRGYRDLSESTNLDLGFSYARGHNDFGSAFFTDLYGADATLRWKPLRRAIYHSLLARTELVWSNREQMNAVQRAFGFYSSGEYRLNRRWTLGGRYDWSERAAAPNLADSGVSTILTYWPSEFSQVRGQYRYARYARGLEGNELRFQFLFVLGAHGAHPF